MENYNYYNADATSANNAFGLFKTVLVKLTTANFFDSACIDVSPKIVNIISPIIFSEQEGKFINTRYQIRVLFQRMSNLISFNDVKYKNINNLIHRFYINNIESYSLKWREQYQANSYLTLDLIMKDGNIYILIDKTFVHNPDNTYKDLTYAESFLEDFVKEINKISL